MSVRNHPFHPISHIGYGIWDIGSYILHKSIHLWAPSPGKNPGTAPPITEYDTVISGREVREPSSMIKQYRAIEMASIFIRYLLRGGAPKKEKKKEHDEGTFSWNRVAI